MAQDYLESVLALHPQSFGDSIGTVTTTPSSETTPFPLDVLRVDALWRLDDTGRPLYQLDLVQKAGAHLPSEAWPQSISSLSFGEPLAAWTNGRSFFWSPVPRAAYALRWYGLQAQPDITVAGTITYPDICLTPLATFAAKLIRTGLDDSTGQLDALADALFTPVVAAMKGFRRDRPQTLTYSQVHTT
jgi:hypothetical protein